jgi:hypothetical protein
MKLRNTLYILVTFLVMIAVIVPGSFVYAQNSTTQNDNNGNNHDNKNRQEVVGGNVGDETGDETEDNESESIFDILTPAAPSKSPATSTPSTEPQATTTQPTATTTKPVPTKPVINEDVEDVLNENLEPEKPIQVNKPKTELPATTTATTTPVAGTTGSDINGSSNSFAPNNYYIPLDNLSPAMTYTLSFIAMILGISGAVLIIRDPRTQTEKAWAPARGFAREPLLEP